MTGCVHIIGAGLSGLSAAVELANNGIPVIVHEGAGHAGGRCRSYFDSELDRMIDNGNHLVLSGNHATLNYLRLVGSLDTVKIVKPAEVNFLDLANNDCWVVRPDKGRIPWSWIRKEGRVPGSSIIDYLKCWRLMRATEDQTISDVLPTEGDLWKKFWVPFIVSITNTDAELASSGPVRRVVEETLAKGEVACRPVLFPLGLTQSLIAPAIEFIRQRGGEVHFNQRINRVQKSYNRITKLYSPQNQIEIAESDSVIFALPSATVSQLVNDINVPNSYSPIVNGHFRLPVSVEAPPVLGLVNGTAEWLFLRNDIVSVTVSAARLIVDFPAEKLAEIFWKDVQLAYDLKSFSLPPNRIIKEKRATFLQNPIQLCRRPGPRTHIYNLFLAGDWTKTGLPATIEGSVRSGVTAAKAAFRNIIKHV